MFTSFFYDFLVTATIYRMPSICSKEQILIRKLYPQELCLTPRTHFRIRLYTMWFRSILWWKGTAKSNVLPFQGPAIAEVVSNQTVGIVHQDTDMVAEHTEIKFIYCDHAPLKGAQLFPTGNTPLTCCFQACFSKLSWNWQNRDKTIF